MGRFHVCMPVVENDGFRCFVCHRDMRAEMSEYDNEIDSQTKVAAVRTRNTGNHGSASGPVRGHSRDARLGLG